MFKLILRKTAKWLLIVALLSLLPVLVLVHVRTRLVNVHFPIDAKAKLSSSRRQQLLVLDA